MRKSHLKINLQSFLNQATSAPRIANLMAATRAIQSALALTLPQTQTPACRPAAPEAQESKGEVIDIEAVTLNDASPSAADRVIDPDGRFVEGSHTTPQGRRDYKLYIPPQAAWAKHPLPLVVMLHGCTQDADDFAAGTAMNAAARERGLFVLYPQQSAQANPQRCWNWFKHSHQARERGEPALLASMVRTVMASQPIDPDRVWVAGLSAGGAMAAILAQTHPDLFAAAGVHSGLAAGSARDLPSAMAAMRQGASTASDAAAIKVPTIVFHGDADTTVHPANGTQAFSAALTAGSKPGSGVAVEQPGRRSATRRIARAADGSVQAEHWLVQGAPHAWSGGSSRGSYTDPTGPDATVEMLRFFSQHPRIPSAAAAAVREPG